MTPDTTKRAEAYLALADKVDDFTTERNHMFGTGMVPSLDWEKAEAIAEDELARSTDEAVAIIRALLAERKGLAMCDVCLGQPLPSGKDCICGGAGTSAAEKVGLRLALHESERQGWRPISEAPKDRKACLIYVPGNQCSYCVSWDDGDPADPESRRGWHIFGGGWRAQLQDATHYMPLPVPPSSAAGKGVGE